jgi:hypothetical protein
MKIIYTDGPDCQELPEGLGLIERGKPFEVPDALGIALIQQGGFESADGLLKASWGTHKALTATYPQELLDDAIINVSLEKE